MCRSCEDKKTGRPRWFQDHQPYVVTVAYAMMLHSSHRHRQRSLELRREATGDEKATEGGCQGGRRREESELRVELDTYRGVICRA